MDDYHIYIGQQVKDDDRLRFDYRTRHTLHGTMDTIDKMTKPYNLQRFQRVIQYFRFIPYIDVIIRMDDLTSGLRSVSDTGIFLAR